MTIPWLVDFMVDTQSCLDEARTPVYAKIAEKRLLALIALAKAAERRHAGIEDSMEEVIRVAEQTP